MLHLQVFNLLPCKPGPVAFKQTLRSFAQTVLNNRSRTLINFVLTCDEGI